MVRGGVSKAETHAGLSAGGGLDKEWPPSCTAAGIPDARGLASTPTTWMHASGLPHLGIWPWMPPHVWWTPAQHPLLGGAVVPP